MKKQDVQREMPTYFGILPAEIRYSKLISPMEKVMYAEISALASKTGKCWGSNGYFASLYDVEPTTVSEWINNLRRAGFISISGAKAKNRIISLVSILRKKPKTPSEKPESQPKEKAEHNNTSINNKNNTNATQDNFSSLEELNKWVNSPQEWLAIIGAFAKRKKLHEKLKSKAQIQQLIGRYRKIAEKLAAFDRKQIVDAFNKCDEMKDKIGKPIDWTLFTVHYVLLK